MARLPRLVIAGQAHCVVQRGHSSQTVFSDAADRDVFLASLRDAALAESVQLHAYALLDAELRLLLTPAQPPALGRLMQSLGRRYVSAYNRRHQRTGTLWDGRFRCAVVEPGALRLAVLRWIDAASSEPGWTSAAARSGGAAPDLIVDPPEFWTLGNTPFEREARWRQLLAQGLEPAVQSRLERAARGGWALGSPAFVSHVANESGRPAAPRPRGRPRAPKPDVND